VAQAGHNIQTDAAWFFPALSSLNQFSNPNYLFSYVGQEQHNGASTQHIRVAFITTFPIPSVQTLSTMDFYLDSTTLLPLAITFYTHPDKDANKNIREEILFANYQSVGGLQISTHFQRLLDGSLVLDATVVSPAINTGVPDNTFVL
jgi:hypothetical protein